MSWDVIIVGGGSAGAAAAYQCARSGLATVLLEKHALADAGATWVNGIYRGAFDEAGIAQPEAPELRAAGHRFHLVAGWGPNSVAIDNTGLLDVDMRHLLARLRTGARAAGAELREHSGVRAIRAGAVDTATSTLRARLVIDASGLGGLYRSEKPRPSEVCTAAQGVYAIRDQAAARAFFAGFGAVPGETVCFAAVAGGYSIVAARIDTIGSEGSGDAAVDELSILTGSLPALGFAAGKALRDDFAARHPWIGDMVFGGHAPVPLHRPRRRLAFVTGDGAIVRLGDAAGQVYAAHGSGVGAQLVAARMLAERVAKDGVNGALGFERAWHRRFGAAFFAADAFRRISTLLGPRSVDFMMRRGLLPKSLIRFGFAAGL